MLDVIMVYSFKHIKKLVFLQALIVKKDNNTPMENNIPLL